MGREARLGWALWGCERDGRRCERHAMQRSAAACRRTTLGQALPVAAAADECYRAALDSGLGDSDFSAVYKAIADNKP